MSSITNNLISYFCMTENNPFQIYTAPLMFSAKVPVLRYDEGPEYR